jgi:hypothetical protein
MRSAGRSIHPVSRDQTRAKMAGSLRRAVGFFEMVCHGVEIGHGGHKGSRRLSIPSGKPRLSSGLFGIPSIQECPAPQDKEHKAVRESLVVSSLMQGAGRGSPDKT